jgi:hypothetical protein
MESDGKKEWILLTPSTLVTCDSMSRDGAVGMLGWKAFFIISRLHYIQVCLPVRYWFNETAESEVNTNVKNNYSSCDLNLKYLSLCLCGPNAAY